MMIDDANPYVISIHALRKESDLSSSERTATMSRFQSTLSVRRATGSSQDTVAAIVNFNPRSP